MAKSLSTILNQIERLQREAASIQSEVIGRMKKEIAKYGLTADHLFGQSAPPSTAASKASKKSSTTTRAPKYADGTGNTWGGMGKRPEWLRQALDAGKALEEFLIASVGAKASARPTPKKKAVKSPASADRTAATTVKQVTKKKAATRGARAATKTDSTGASN